MSIWLRQSTAVEVAIGPFLDETDGKTPETALTISQADVRLKKQAGDWGQKNESTAAAHEENGNYRCLLDTTDTASLGRLRLHVNESGALPVWENYMVVPAVVYDSLFEDFGVFSGTVFGTVGAGSTTTSVTTADLTEVTNDHYKNKIITFTKGILIGQSAKVTAYNGTTKALAVTTLTDTPAENDKFILT